MLKYDLKGYRIFVFLFIVFLSFSTALLLIGDLSKPNYYSFLFVLPLTFAVLSVVFAKLYEEIMRNLGITVLLILLFVRMVISPLFMLLGSYAGTIEHNVSSNTLMAIFLVSYEALCLFLFLFVKIQNIKASKKKYIVEEYVIRPRITRSYKWILAVAVVALVVCIFVAPGIMDTYRSITQIGDKDFTSHEDAYVVTKYATSFTLKFALVTGQYLFRALIVIVPSFLIIHLAKKNTRARTLFGLLFCCIPFFFISGTVAKTLIYSICLFMLHNYMFHNGYLSKNSIYIVALGGIAVIAWWLFRSNGRNLNVMEQFSRRFSSYFSGVNVVSGAFNLPNELEYKIRYFFNDFMRSIPYGTTIFGLDFDPVASFFNEYNFSSGQIPPTIGMGCYYFGPLLAPIYSLVFANIACDAGEFLKRKQFGNPIRCLRLMLTVFYFSMGVVMYNIDIALTTFFTLLFPMYIMEKIGYEKGAKV